MSFNDPTYNSQPNTSTITICVDILPALKGKDSHGTAPLSWDVYGL
jgi:hypothetical protein